MARDAFREQLARLYQLPLAEFTKARDDWAKQDPSRRADIRKLQKPNVPAWAVNQLYWRERGAYEALVAAAERLRKAQMASLTGKAADVPAAEAAHAGARKSAVDRVRKILEGTGEKAAPATMTAIIETLDALPAAEPPGSLVRPLKPAGFEALTGLLSGKKIAAKPAAVLPFRKPAAEPRKDDRKEQVAKDKQRKVLTAKARDAEAADRDARAALARARAALAKAERDQDAAKRKVLEADDRLEAAQRDVRDADRRASQAAIALATIKSELAD
jgi:hypothetical protein